MSINPALIGKAGEMLVAAELMRRGIDVAHPASDVGVDLLAYRLSPGMATARQFVPIQVKTRSKSGYQFFRSWFDKAPGLVLVHVWQVASPPELVASKPEFYVFRDLKDVKEALNSHALSPSWTIQGRYNVTEATEKQIELMKPHRDRWERIIDQL